MIKIQKNMIAVWLGTTKKSVEEFNEYTDGLDSDDNTLPIYKDFGMPFIDVDFFGAYGTVNNEIIPIEQLAEEIPTYTHQATLVIIQSALEKGIASGNSLYYYQDAIFIQEIPNKAYNDLTFIGNFPDGRKK